MKLYLNMWKKLKRLLKCGKEKKGNSEGTFRKISLLWRGSFIVRNRWNKKSRKTSKTNYKNLSKAFIDNEKYFEAFKDDPENIQCAGTPKKNDFVLVCFNTKKTTKYYVGLVQEVVDNDQFLVKYMRKKKEKIFVFPQVDDISLVSHEDIAAVLEKPDITSRGIYTFNYNFDAYNAQ